MLVEDISWLAEGVLPDTVEKITTVAIVSVIARPEGVAVGKPEIIHKKAGERSKWVSICHTGDPWHSIKNWRGVNCKICIGMAKPSKPKRSKKS